MRDDVASTRQEISNGLFLPGNPPPVALVGPGRRVGSDAAPHEPNLTARRCRKVTESARLVPYQCGTRKSERGTERERSFGKRRRSVCSAFRIPRSAFSLPHKSHPALPIQP